METQDEDFLMAFNNRVKLKGWSPLTHSERFGLIKCLQPYIRRYVEEGNPSPEERAKLEELLKFYEPLIDNPPSTCVFAIMDQLETLENLHPSSMKFLTDLMEKYNKLPPIKKGEPNE